MAVTSRKSSHSRSVSRKKICGRSSSTAWYLLGSCSGGGRFATEILFKLARQPGETQTAATLPKFTSLQLIGWTVCDGRDSIECPRWCRSSRRTSFSKFNKNGVIFVRGIGVILSSATINEMLKRPLAAFFFGIA